MIDNVDTAIAALLRERGMQNKRPELCIVGKRRRTLDPVRDPSFKRA